MGLNWEHIDLAAGVIHITQSYVSGISGYHLQPPKTGRSRRVKIDEGTRQRLVHLYEREVRERLDLGADTADLAQAAVFRSVYWRRLNPDGVSARWRELCACAGVPPARLHDARHTVATALLDRGIPIHRVSKLLGHSTPATTHSTYSHVIDDLDPAAAAVMASVVDGDAHEPDTND